MHQTELPPAQDRPTRHEGDGTSANRLLAALPDAEFRRWEPHLTLVELTLGQVISEPGVDLGYAYFPITAIVSLLYVMNDGESAEIALVGNDGMLGITLFMGGNSTTLRAVVQSAGMGYRLPASDLLAEVARGGATLRLLLLYTQSLLTQMTQTAACNRHHTLNQQFSRWLLLSFDRLAGHEMVMTQKLIAKMLGVTSDEVTSAATALGASGAISYSGGRISLLDRTALEKTSCECYEVVKRECQRLLPPLPRAARTDR
jgi:CRP-like cAMP-binding protein